MNMLRWSTDQLWEYWQRQSRAQANAEARQHHEDQPRAKYRNKKTQIDGRTFDSKLEASRYCELKRLQAGGIISGLQCQVPFKLEVNGALVCTYRADFVYLDIDNRRVVDDSKGMRTKANVLNRKLMKEVLGIDIQEYRRQRHA